MRVLIVLVGTTVGLTGVALHLWVLWKLWFGWGFVAWLLFGHFLVFWAISLVNVIFGGALWGATSIFSRGARVEGDGKE